MIHIIYHIITLLYKNFKMIILTHMISILHYIFNNVFYVMR
jgi:hypothetical protein